MGNKAPVLNRGDGSLELVPREAMELLSLGSFESRLEGFFGRPGSGICKLVGSIQRKLDEV